MLTDVCPYTLGVDVGERLANGSVRQGIFAPIIERNTVSPRAARQLFSDHCRTDRQHVDFGIYQGESPDVSRQHRARQDIDAAATAAASTKRRSSCRFTYDINGLLEVDVFVPKTGERRQVVIVDQRSTHDEAEVARRREALASLKVHPRDQEINRAMIARGERCYEDSLGDRRAYVGQCLSQFLSVVEGQDPRAIEAAREQFAKVLDAIEGETFL